MSKWHISPITEGPEKCGASVEDCPYKNESDHYSTKEEAQDAFEEGMKESLFSVITKSKKFRRMARVGASVSVALVSLVGVNNIANAAPVESSPSFGDFVDGLSDYDYQGALEELETKTTRFFEDTVKPSKEYEEVNSAFEDLKDSFSGFFGWGGSAASTVIVDDGTVLWQGKSLTPTDSEVAEAKASLESLVVAREGTGEGYNRNKMFGANTMAAKGDTENRDIRDGVFDRNGRVISGTLNDPYTGKSMSFDGGDRLHDLEHLVALKEVYRSEDPNNPLTDSQRRAIASDPNNLLLVESGENRSKSDKDAKDYLPSYQPSQCRFAISTIKVKSDYGLRVDPGEKNALSNVLDNRCEIN